MRGLTRVVTVLHNVFDCCMSVPMYFHTCEKCSLERAIKLFHRFVKWGGEG